MPRRSAMRRLRALAWLAALGLAPGVGAEPASAPEAAPATGGAGLERLLRLPSGLDYQVDERGGATRGEWRSRFEEARSAVARARRGVAAAQEALESEAGATEAWRMAPPGAGAAQGPVSYKLRQELRRQRDELRRAEKRLRDLEIEANLAGVPADWRGGQIEPPADARSPSASPDPLASSGAAEGR